MAERKRSNFVDLSGQRFGGLTVIEPIGKDKCRGIVYKCKCDCGSFCNVRGTYLRNGERKSCGCLNEKRPDKSYAAHNLSRTKIYQTWRAMFARCNNKKNPEYKNYGGRGIKICDEWNSFLVFYDWAMSHGYKEGLQIDRIDNNGNYEPSNCRFADRYTQANNTTKNHYITALGEKKTVSQWAKYLDIERCALGNRLKTARKHNLPESFVIERSVRLKELGKEYYPIKSSFDYLMPDEEWVIKREKQIENFRTTKKRRRKSKNL